MLKPADLFGGQDVVIGRFVDSFTWLRSIELAVQRRHVVQQYVPVLELEVPSGHVTAQGSLDYVHKYATVGLFCISDLCTAGVVRVSDQPVTNITQGGGLSTVAVVSGKR